jgi:hypothetical protein
MGVNGEHILRQFVSFEKRNDLGELPPHRTNAMEIELAAQLNTGLPARSTSTPA